MRKLSILAEAAILLCLGLLALLVVRQGLALPRHTAAQAVGTDTTAACAANLHRLELAFTQYAQDNDEVFPPMQTASAFQAALLPYVKDPAVFRCPDTGLPYTPNAALSRKSYPSITGDVDTVEVVRDSAPHRDGLVTVVFLDGHVEHGGVEYGDPTVITTQREKDVATAVLAYAQDNNEIFPPMHTPQELQASVYPYVHRRRLFNAPTGQPFVPNAALSGVASSTISDPAVTVVVQDTPPYLDGVLTIAYADGHLERGGIEYGDPNAIVVSRAKQLALAVTMYVQDNNEVFPPMQTVSAFQAALTPYLKNRKLYFNTRGQPFVPNAALSGVSLASVADFPSTVLFQDTSPYTGGAPTTAYADGHVTHVAAPPHTHLLWNNTDGRVILWSLAADGSFTYHLFGPYTDGSASTPWHASALATGPDGKSHLLWTNPDGRVILWTVDDSGSFSYAVYGPYTDDGTAATPWSAKALSVGPDNILHILWTNPNGRVILWAVDTSFRFTNAVYGPYTDGSPSTPWHAAALATGADNVTHVLWNNPDGRVIVWDVDPAFHFIYQVYGPYTDGSASTPWSASALAAGPDEKVHLLWTNPNGRVILWNVDSAFNFTLAAFGPYTDGSASTPWSASALATGPDNLSHLLWTNPDNRVILWDIDPVFNFAYNVYGPYTDGAPQNIWSATAVSAWQ